MLYFASLIAIYLGVVLILLILMGILWVSCILDLGVCFLPPIREVLSYYSSNKFSSPFTLSPFSGTPIIWVLLRLMESLSSWSLFSCSVIILSFVQLYYFPFFFSRSLSYLSPHSSALFIIWSGFLISSVASFIFDWFIFNTFISVVRLSLRSSVVLNPSLFPYGCSKFSIKYVIYICFT